MSLALEVEAAFSAGGVLARTTEHFVPRSEQTEMALAVAGAIESGRALVVEASTGVGKTFAYLVPALLSGQRILVSTATKALQDQLFGRDLPRLVQAFRLPVQMALLKGRASYLCLHRMEMARQEMRLSEGVSAHSLARVEQWSQVTHTGDLAELPEFDERSLMIPLMTSTRDNCLGSQCPRFRDCHVILARRRAMAADVVVTNHHLFFADLAVRESGVAELLPSVGVVIFDEAHQLNDTGVQFLGFSLSTGQLLDFSRDMLAAGLQLARGLVDWQGVASATEQAARELRLCVGRQSPGSKLRWTDLAPEGLESTDWKRALEDVHRACDQAAAALDTVSEIAPDFVRLHERATQLIERIEAFLEPCVPGFVRWADVASQLQLVESPLDISEAVKSRMIGHSSEVTKSWIFTSATLGEDEKLSWFTHGCGLEDADLLRIGSPFDYGRQASLYVPGDFPKPVDPAHALHVAEHAAVWARQLGGRTMVLTTTLRALRTIGNALQEAFATSQDLQVLIQGSMPKRALIERFRQGHSQGGKACLLVASASFWEGIDVAGEALELLIIDKLPFPPPNDPLAMARSKMLESQGRSAFAHYFLPEAAVALKQGAGRLIRRESDQGVLVVCDSRLMTMGYGRRLLKALPAMQRLNSEQELMDRLASFTRTCTKDSQPT
ncbi:MAG: ATP-dependent DNA helicase [Polaromonas sp.]